MNVPDLRSYCTCGHLANQHRGGSQRPCREPGCTCDHLQKVPRPRCGDCNHPVSFRTRQLPDGRLGCSATGCHCVEWVEPDPGHHAATPAATVEVKRTGPVLSVTLPSPGPEYRMRVKITPTDQVEIFLSPR